MSILNKQIEIRPDPAKQAASELLYTAQKTFAIMVDAFNESARTFWVNNNGATPEQIASELGVDAVEIFQLHAKLGSLLSDIDPSRIEQGLGIIGNFTMNENGTVTILQ